MAAGMKTVAFEVSASDILEPPEMPRICLRKQALGRIAVIREPQPQEKPEKRVEQGGPGDYISG